MYSIDLKGEHCPIPVLKTKKKLNEMSSGETLEILVTDKLAPLDIEALIGVTKDKFIGVSRSIDETYYRVVVEKS